MPHIKCAVTVTAALMLMAANAAQPTIEGKPDFSGTWRMESQDSKSWVIQQEPGSIHIRNAEGSEKEKTDVRCGLMGEECSGRIEGDKAKVVFYYNGPTLVQMTTRGKNVSKIRRTLSDDGNRITVEITPYVPAGDKETLVLVRAGEPPQTAAKAQ